MNTLQLITHANWMQEELSQASEWHINQSYGLDVPLSKPEDSWWMPQASYVQMQRSLEAHSQPPLEFIGPSPYLLERTVPSLVGRKVATGPVGKFRENFDNCLPGWWKLATAKSENFPAAERTPEEVLQLINQLHLPDETVLQYSEGIENIHSEYRFFINSDEKGKRQIVAQSGYLNEGQSVYDGAVFDKQLMGVASDAVTELLERMEHLVPPAFVVDVAILKWFTPKATILEYNPAWCSAWYDADIEQVLETIHRATHPHEEDMEWYGYVPDASLVHQYGKPETRILPMA